MFKRILLASTVVLTLGSLAQAEIARALLTKENKFPAKGQLELGTFYSHSEFDLTNTELSALRPYARYGLVENLTFRVDVPYIWTSPETGEDENGLGDVRLEVDLLAYKDIFDFPYVIPHVDVTTQTGDEDKGLSSGETVWDLGVSVGTVTHDVLHWVADFAYVLNGGTEVEDRENVFKLSGSLIWDLNEQFALLIEGLMLDENSANDRPYYFQGGMTYLATEDLMLGLYGGGWSQTDEDVVINVKVGYQF